MRKILLLVLIFISVQVSSQNKLDSAKLLYDKIQAEITTKELGEFEEVVKDDKGIMRTKKIITNYYSGDGGQILWTIVSKYKYDEKGKLRHTEFWKTNNIDKACKCNVWLLREKPLIKKTIYHESCKKGKLNCDEQGRYKRN